MKGNLLGLDFAVLDFHLVSDEHNGNVFADARQVSVPVGNTLVGDATGDVEHDDCALSLDVVSITESSKLFLTSRVPAVEFDGAAVGVKDERVDFDAEGGHVLFLEFARQVALNKGCFA